MNGMQQNKLVIGVDQSYTSTGLSLCINGKLTKVSSLKFKGLESKTEKRNELRRVLTLILTKASQKGYEITIICERIRTFSDFGNKKDKSGGLRPSYLMMTGALIATIVDTGASFGVETYSVDTRAWKSKVVGSAKSKKDKDGKRDAKGETVEFVQNLGFDLFIREKKTGKNKGEAIYDDDAADAACIALYGFIPVKLQNLKLEE